MKWVCSSYNGILEILFSREEKPLGTAGAIINAQHLIKSDDFFIINGDTFLSLNYLDFMSLQKGKLQLTTKIFNLLITYYLT